MKKVFYMAVATLLMMGCSQNEPTETTGNAIGFRTSIGKSEAGQTYASGTILSRFNNFAVYANWNKDGAGDYATYVYLDKQFVEKKATNWVYAPTKYWPATGKVDFYAYSPATSLNVTTFNNTTQSAPKLTYTVPTIFNQQEDFLVAKAADQTSASNPVQLQFDHALSHFVFEARGLVGPNDTVRYTVSRIVLTNINSVGELDLTATSLTAAASWTLSVPVNYVALDSISPVKVKYDVAAGSNWTKLTSDTLNTALTLLPGSWSAPSNTALVKSAASMESGRSYIALTYSVKGLDGQELNTDSDNGTVYIPLSVTYAANTRYVYRFTFGSVLEPVTFSATLQDITNQAETPLPL